MKDEREVTEERLAIRVGGGVVVGVVRHEGVGGDLAVLASEVAHFACVGGVWVARDLNASLKGIEMAQGSGAVAVRGGSLVDVVG